MSGDVFNRPKASADCLSAWQVSRLAQGSLQGLEMERARVHLESCARCAEASRAEALAMETARYERLPDAIATAAQHPRRRFFPRITVPIGATGAIGAIGALAAVASIAAIALSPQPPGERLKGELPLSLSVMRSDRIVVDRAPLETVTDLRAGDRLRLHLDVDGVRWVRADGPSEVYFEGALPEDGWLPLGLTITSIEKVPLRIVGCPREPTDLKRSIASGECLRRDLEL